MLKCKTELQGSQLERTQTFGAVIIAIHLPCASQHCVAVRNVERFFRLEIIACCKCVYDPRMQFPYGSGAWMQIWNQGTVVRKGGVEMETALHLHQWRETGRNWPWGAETRGCQQLYGDSATVCPWSLIPVVVITESPLICSVCSRFPTTALSLLLLN